MRAVSKFMARAIEDGIYETPTDRLVELVIEMEKEIKAMDFTEPLYRHFKKIMEKEDPKGL